MSKFYYFAVIITGLMVLMNLGGYQTPVTGTILSALNVNMTHGSESLANVQQSILWSNAGSRERNFGLVQIIELIIVGGAIVSFFGRSPDINLLLAGLILTFATFLLTDLTFLAQKLISIDKTWIKAVALTIFVPMTIGFIVSTISYIKGGND